MNKRIQKKIAMSSSRAAEAQELPRVDDKSDQSDCETRVYNFNPGEEETMEEPLDFPSPQRGSTRLAKNVVNSSKKSIDATREIISHGVHTIVNDNLSVVVLEDCHPSSIKKFKNYLEASDHRGNPKNRNKLMTNDVRRQISRSVNAREELIDMDWEELPHEDFFTLMRQLFDAKRSSLPGIPPSILIDRLPLPFKPGDVAWIHNWDRQVNLIYDFDDDKEGIEKSVLPLVVDNFYRKM